MITLTFRPLQGEATLVARGTYFRICADDTLRGPDNAVTARYVERQWHLGQRHCRQFESSGPVFLRVTDLVDRKETIGPYDFIRAAEGMLFTREARLGTHSGPGFEPGTWRWREVVLLSADADRR